MKTVFVITFVRTGSALVGATETLSGAKVRAQTDMKNRGRKTPLEWARSGNGFHTARLRSGDAVWYDVHEVTVTP